MQPNDSWSNDLLPLIEGFLDGPLCESYHRQQGLELWPLHLLVILTVWMASNCL